MNVINYISNMAIPIVILVIVTIGIKEKKNVFDIFLKGAREGIQIVIKIFPTLIGLFLAISLLRSSGILNGIITLISPILRLLKIPSEILPLAMLRPISGSASIAVATDIMTTFGVDSKIGLIASTMMGSTETTIYTIAVYTSSVDIKDTRFVLFSALCADIVGMIASIVVCNFFF